MAMSEQQRRLIVAIDHQVKTVLASGGGDEVIVMTLFKDMPKVRELMQTALKKDIALYLQEYDGFCRYMTLLETLAQCVTDG